MLESKQPEEPEARLDLLQPQGSAPDAPAWKLLAWNKRILKGLIELCRDTPQDAVHCFDWLKTDAM